MLIFEPGYAISNTLLIESVLESNQNVALRSKNKFSIGKLNFL